MDFITVNYWDEDIWQQWKGIYFEAFGEKNCKPEKVIRNMFRKQMCYFHLAKDGKKITAIALSGKLEGTKALLIDYLSVSKDARGQGIGTQLVDYLTEWAKESGQFSSIVIEAEAEDTEENTARVEFWKRCGFESTSYIHYYKVVPEPYKAMYFKLFPEAYIPEKAETIFQYFSKFHQKCFRGA